MPISPAFISCSAEGAAQLESESLWQKNGQLC